jgi:ribosomal protein L37AE/L43A
MAISLRRKILNIDTNVKCTLQCPSCKRTDLLDGLITWKKVGENIRIKI